VAVQSNQGSTAPGSLSTSVTYASANIAGDSSTVAVTSASFAPYTSTSVTVTDTSGNAYVLQSFYNGGTGGINSTWVFAAVGIAAASAGSNTVLATITSSAFGSLAVIIIEGPSASAVRVVNQNSAGFAGPNATVSLASTVLADYVIGVCSITESIIGSGATAGNIGTNAATKQQVFVDVAGGGNNIMVEDGTSSGGTINVTATGDANTNVWVMQALAFIPAAKQNQNSLYFGSD
jgi:hypothetical protein